jgi:ABC-type multidrug transport system fused ATPase/permease subunit
MFADKIAKQPESYSDILVRVYVITNLVGIFCVLILVILLPQVHSYVDNIIKKAQLSSVKNANGLYVLITAFPLVLSIFSRGVLLHNKLQKPFGLRKRFEQKYLLFPLANAVNFNLSGSRPRWLKKRQGELMGKTIYKFASFKSPVIDPQLVMSVADRWGWIWVALESSFLLFITAIFVLFTVGWVEFLIPFTPILLFSILAIIQWPELKKRAQYQIREIVSDPSRKKEIQETFKDVCRPKPDSYISPPNS